MPTLDPTRYELPGLLEWPAGDSRELNFTVETNGVAKDVPLFSVYPPSTAVDRISTPGAASSTLGPVSLNDATVSDLSVAPTATTVSYAAG
jgi:hypothetical protein